MHVAYQLPHALKEQKKSWRPGCACDTGMCAAPHMYRQKWGLTSDLVRHSVDGEHQQGLNVQVVGGLQQPVRA
jgi:hypothetical protein